MFIYLIIVDPESPSLRKKFIIISAICVDQFKPNWPIDAAYIWYTDLIIYLVCILIIGIVQKAVYTRERGCNFGLGLILRENSENNFNYF